MTQAHQRIQAQYHFSEDELHQNGARLAHLHNELEIAKEARKARLQEENKKINGISLDIAIISRGIRNGWEMRDYDCVMELDRTTKERVWRDIHTKEIRKREPFTADDYQGMFA